MRKNIITVVGITILFLGTCITPSVAIDNVKSKSVPISNGNILYVGGTGEGNYSKIQDAINDAVDGDTVFVYAYSSPYYEYIRVNKSINLIGEDKETTIIDGGGERTGVLIWGADEVYISGFTIQNCDSEIWSYIYGIRIYSDFNTITGNIITKNKVGILIDTSKGNIITGNTISYNGGGVSLKFSNGNTITGNTISYNNNSNGITIANSHDNNITGNTISNNLGGVGVFDSERNIIQKNNFLHNTRQALFWHYISLINPENPERNIWNQNYWNRTRILPKLIIGLIILIYPIPIIPIPLPWLNIDWHPALKPYDI